MKMINTKPGFLKRNKLNKNIFYKSSQEKL